MNIVREYRDRDEHFYLIKNDDGSFSVKQIANTGSRDECLIFEQSFAASEARAARNCLLERITQWERCYEEDNWEIA